jgi:hypothetical protein
MKTQMLFVLTALTAISPLQIHAINRQKQKNHHYRELKDSLNELSSASGRLLRRITLSLMKSIVIFTTGATATIIIAPIVFKESLNAKDIVLATALGAGFWCFGKYHCNQLEKIIMEKDQNKAKAKAA